MTEIQPDPPDIPGEDEGPNRLLAIIVAIRVFNEVEPRLDADEDADLILRLIAIRSVLRRVRHRLENPNGG